MATTATTDETPIRIPSTVRNERSLLARRAASAIRAASEKGISSALRRRFSIFPSRM